MSAIKIGDTVIWTSQAQGTEKTKSGEVLAVIEPGQSAFDIARKHNMSKSSRKFDTDISKKLRLLVAVPRGGQSKLFWYYCPFATSVEKVEGGETA